MTSYSAYGLTIQSAFELPELTRVESTDRTPDVVFRRGAVDPVPESVDGTGGRRITAGPDHCRLSYDSYGSFLVERGERVTFDPASPDVVETKIIRRLLENEMLGVLLHQRGRLVLHASAVSVDGRAVIFLGPRGVGKSTTAAAFHEHGYPILEDDIVSVRFDDETPIVDPGVPEMRLKPDAVDGLAIEGTTSHADDGGSGKRYQQFPEVPDAVPLAGCYVLDTADAIGFREIPQRGALFNLVNHTYTQGLLSDTDQAGAHFQQCSAIADRVPFKLLERPEDHDELPALIDTVVADVRPADTA